MPTAVLALLRRDLRLNDQPMLAAAAQTGRPVLPVFILDPQTEAMGAASRWRLGLALQEFARTLHGIGSRLILRRGPVSGVVQDLLGETGAGAVFWSRVYDAHGMARDAALKAMLGAQGTEARSFPGFLLHEPWTIATAQGGPFKVYTPFWNAVSRCEVAPCLPPPKALPAPPVWPASEELESWTLGAGMHGGAAVCAPYQTTGEQNALDRLDRFLSGPVGAYHQNRDYPGQAATSGLSENLTLGEIGPRQIWHCARRAMLEGSPGAEHFLKELVWREFAWSLMFHSPDLGQRNWRRDWDSFPWRGDNPDAERWRRGMTGEPFVDAAMRQMYVTGTMHGRSRMIAASYLTKHLLTDWRVGLDWFAECLTDWDPASNAMGWQWVAGSGPDATPYFRVFNPALQAEKFDSSGNYQDAWIAERSGSPPQGALAFFDAAPGSWALDPGQIYPAPLVGLAEGRARALTALSQRNA